MCVCESVCHSSADTPTVIKCVSCKDAVSVHKVTIHLSPFFVCLLFVCLFVRNILNIGSQYCSHPSVEFCSEKSFIMLHHVVSKY